MVAKSSLRNSCRAARLSVVASASLVALVLMTSLQAHAQDSYWTLSPSVSGNWSNAGNWSLGVPDSSLQAYLVNGGTATITSTATCSDLILGNGARERNPGNDSRQPLRARGARELLRHRDACAVRRHQ